MQIAIISDIQGNAVALECVLQQIKRDGIEQIICLGDLVSGPEPIRVLDLLREHGVICVRGNMDNVILHPTPYTGDNETEHNYAEMDQWCHEQLSASDKAYLNTLPLTYTIEFSAISGLCFHGSPQSTEDVIEAITSDDQLQTMLADTPQNILITGHMHNPMLRTYGNQVILNPGSIGLPYGGKRPMPTQAEYAVISIDDVDFTIEFKRIHYDGEEFKRRLLISGMPHAGWYLEKWLIE